MASLGMLKIVRSFSSSSKCSGKLAPMPISVYGVGGRYASAVYSAATKEKKLDAVEKDMQKLKGWMATDKKFSSFVLDPSLNKVYKIDILKKVFGKQGCNNITVNLMACLVENGQSSKIPAVVNTFEQLMNAHRGQVISNAVTAKELTAAERKELETTIQGFLGKGQSLKLTCTVDPSLIGGMKVTIGDMFVDMSMSAKVKDYASVIRESVYS